MKYTLASVLETSISGEWGDDCSPNDGVFVLRTTNFTNTGRISYEKIVRRAIEERKVACKRLRPGDVIVEKSGGTKDNPVGRVVFFDRQDDTFLCNNFTAALRPNTSLVHPKYLFYVLFALYKMKVTESLYNKTTGIQNLQMKKYLALEIPLPSLSRQREIAAVLDRICALKRNAEAQLAQLKLLAKSRFVEMFCGENTPAAVELSSVAEISSGLTKNSKRATFLLRYKYLRVANVFFNRLDLTDVAEIGVEEREVKKCLLAKDDLLFVEGNGSKDQIGRVALWNGSISPCLHQNHLIKARFNEAVLPVYALHYFMSQEGRRQIVEGAVSTSGLHTLSTGKIAKFKLPLPKMNLQRQFAAFIEQLDKSAFAVKKLIEQYDLLYRAKLQEYFG